MSIATKIAHILEKSVRSAGTLSIRVSGEMEAFPGGTNGPHGALETPVRNTCHWIVALLAASRHFGERSYLERAMRLRRWLLDANNPFGRYPTFVMRSASGQDAVNGVIGAAWLLEALHSLRATTDDQEAVRRGAELLAVHPLSRSGAWRRFDPVTDNFSVDYTYDHQAWFAAAAADWGDEGMQRARVFLDSLAEGALRVRKDGRIVHLYHCRTPKCIALRAMYGLRERQRPGSQAELEHGYQLYSLYPLARLRRHFPQHAIFESSAIRRALAYCTPERVMRLKTNRFGYAYNAPGLELPMVYCAFRGALPLQAEDVLTIMDDQVRTTADPDTGLNTRNTPDPLTLAARVYELAMSLDCALQANL